MRDTHIAGFLLGIAWLAAFPVHAQETLSPPVGRFSFMAVSEGVLRLDTVTGEVALCRGNGDDRSCDAVPETGPGASETRFADQMAALEARITALEARAQSTSEPLSDDEALDRVLLLSERMLRHFFGVVRELRQDSVPAPE